MSSNTNTLSIQNTAHLSLDDSIELAIRNREEMDLEFRKESEKIKHKIKYQNLVQEVETETETESELESEESNETDPKKKPKILKKFYNGKEYYDAKPNKESREIFFSIVCDYDKKYWHKESTYRAFMNANLFAAFVTDKRFIVSNTKFLEKLMEMYDSVDPPIDMYQRENYNFYKALPKEIYLDMLQFITIEGHIRKVNVHKDNNLVTIPETLVKLILRDYGMRHMPDTVIDLAKKGFDKLRRRIYDIDDVIKYPSIVQAVVGETVRTKAIQQKYDLKPSTDWARKYPNFARRWLNSPMI